MSGVLSAVAAVATIAGTAVSAVQSSNQADAQKKAQDQALGNAKKQQDQASMQFAQQNQLKPDVAKMLADAQNNAKGGVSGTMLTGPGGVDPNSLSLGKSTLLGS